MAKRILDNTHVGKLKYGYVKLVKAAEEVGVVGQNLGNSVEFRGTS